MYIFAVAVRIVDLNIAAAVNTEASSAAAAAD
jgi:hypothetical protein